MNIKRSLIEVVLHPKLFPEGNYFILEEYDMRQEAADDLEKILQKYQGFEKTYLLAGKNEWKVQPNENIAIVTVAAVDESGEEEYYSNARFGIDFKTCKVFFMGAEDV